jgi:FkbM family methyltransferase
MLIDFNEVYAFLKQHGKVPRGVLHVGAHECEEKETYNKHGIQDKNIIWVDGNEDLVKKIKERGIPNAYHALVDEIERDVTFYITNNGQSSSILEMGTHATMYPTIQVVEKRPARTTTLKALQAKESIDFSNLNFWNFDIQGVELQALKGAGDLLRFADALYLEVNTDDVYKNCSKLPEVDSFLEQNGFSRAAISIYRNDRPEPDGWGDALYIRMKKTEGVLFDIGANRGLYTDKNRYKYEKCILVDANPELTSGLREKYKYDKGIEVIEAIVSNKESETFYIANSDQISTADPEWISQSRFSKSARWSPLKGIPTISVDKLISLYGVPAFLKIDVEGYEYNVLLSLTQKVPALAFEWAEEKKSEILLTMEHLHKLGFTKFHIQMEDEYSYQVEDSEWYDYSIAYKLLQSICDKDRKQRWGMIWAL